MDRSGATTRWEGMPRQRVAVMLFRCLPSSDLSGLQGSCPPGVAPCRWREREKSKRAALSGWPWGVECLACGLRKG
jgi:hypothetical protein